MSVSASHSNALSDITWSSSWSTGPSLSQRSRRGPGHSRKVWTSRVIFLISLVSVAGLLAYVSHRLLTDSEERLAEEHYDATAERALNEALDITLRKRLGVKSLATMMSYTFPDAAAWPNVSMKGFEDIAVSVIDVATGTHMGLCPLVKADQIAGFEEFAYNVAFPEINGYPNTTGKWNFYGNGTLVPGVFSFDENRMPYHDTTGETYWGSEYQIVCPFIMHSAGPQILMVNLHSVERFGKVIDEVIGCANQNNETGSAEEGDLDLTECTVLSDMVIMDDQEGTATGPAALIIQPIHPARNTNVLSGVIHSTMEWSDVLVSLFSTEVSGIDCVLETETRAYTYYIDSGVANCKGEGDLHDHHFSKYRRSIDLYSPGLFSYTSAPYTLTLYPTEELFGVYSTRNPEVATVGSGCIVVFTASLFLLYDFFVRREFHRKQAVLEAKKKFLAFIGHEVRTPLSTIAHGCLTLQDEMDKADRQQAERGSADKHDEGTSDNAETPRYELDDWTDLVRKILLGAESADDVLRERLQQEAIESGTSVSSPSPSDP